MTSGENQEAMRLRPHHLFCGRFLPLDKLIRGDEFANALQNVIRLVQSEGDLIITVTEGPDQVCRYCPECRNNRCESPFGSEEAVRKWDSKIVKGLGVSYGQEIEGNALLALIREKAPLEFCRTRCPWKTVCGVFNIIK